MPATFTAFARNSEQSVHGRDQTQIGAVVEQPCLDLGGCKIAELRRSQRRQDVLTFSSGQLVRRCRAWRGRTHLRWVAASVVHCSWLAEQSTRLLGGGRCAEFREVGVDHFLNLSSMSALSESNSKSACAFPVISNANLVRFSSDSSFAFFLRSRSSSTCSALRR